jgi:nicotinamidase-related amidase
VIDVQNEYVTGRLPIAHPPLAQSLSNIGRAMDAATAAGVPVVVIQQSAPASSPIFARGSETWELHHIVAVRAHDHLVEKGLPGAFTGTDLGPWLGRRDVDTVTIVGYSTHNCDDATARQAVHRGLAVELLGDATGTVPLANRSGVVSAEELHRAELVVMQSRYAAVVTTDEWIGALDAGPAPVGDTLLGSYRRAARL